MEELIPPVIPYYIFQVIMVYLLIFFPQLVTIPLKWIGG
jgi:TRAP-type C4-dicarboxylate transport system permease large subunit